MLLSEILEWGRRSGDPGAVVVVADQVEPVLTRVFARNLTPGSEVPRHFVIVLVPIVCCFYSRISHLVWLSELL